MASAAPPAPGGPRGPSPHAAAFAPSPTPPPPFEVLGGKARGLRDLAAAGFEVPAWFVVPAPAPAPGTGRENEAERLAALVRRGCAAIGPGPYAVRSSALDEDGASHSYAGQLTTVLGVRDAAGVLAALPLVWAARASAYRAAFGLDAVEAPPAAIVQRLVAPRVAGVAFSEAPDGGGGALVAAVWGLGAPLMDGRLAGETARVGEDGRVEPLGAREPQPWQALPADGDSDVSGVVCQPAPPRPCLTDDLARRVARLAREVARRLGGPRDVEWAVTADDRLLLLQARPITAPRVLDSANIGESFPGLTLPLTASLACEMYASVYREAAQALGASPRTIADHDAIFTSLLALHAGRLYYDVGAWHRLLGLLPGLGGSGRSLERMMGAAAPGGRPRTRVPALAVLAALPRVGWRALCLRHDADRFTRTARRVAAAAAATPVRAPAEGLAASERLRDSLRGCWVGPITNDLLLMLCNGALRACAERWLGATAAGPTVHRLIACGGAEVPSIGPAAALDALAREAAAFPAWRAALAARPPLSLAELRARPDLAALAAQLDAYLDAWGDRAPEEQQLDRPTYRRQPERLLTLLAARVQHPLPAATRAPRSAAGDLPLDPARRRVLGLLACATRSRLREREALRLERGRLFGAARLVFGRVGEALARDGVVSDPSDIHYLTLDDLRALVRLEPRSAAAYARPRVAARRAAYAEWATIEPPQRLVGGRAAPPPPPPPASQGPDPGATLGLRLAGLGVSPGRVRAPALRVPDPAACPDAAGRVLVARATDPGWVPLFARAAGLVVERGGPLSHAAVVARELGLPAVVGVADALRRVPDGALLEVDGDSGQVHVLGAPEPGRPA